VKSVGSVPCPLDTMTRRKGSNIEVLTGAASNLTFLRAHVSIVSLSIVMFLCQFTFALSIRGHFARAAFLLEADFNEIADFWKTLVNSKKTLAAP